MKKVIVFLVISMVCLTSFSQNSIIGKWKIAKLESKEIGTLVISVTGIATKLYAEKIIQKKDTPITKEEDDEIMQNAQNLFNELSQTKIEYKANKTFIGQFGEEITNGKYVYDKLKKLITTIAKNKPSKKAKIWFEKEYLVMSDLDGKTKSYFSKEK